MPASVAKSLPVPAGHDPERHPGAGDRLHRQVDGAVAADRDQRGRRRSATAARQAAHARRPAVLRLERPVTVPAVGRATPASAGIRPAPAAPAGASASARAAAAGRSGMSS